MRASLDAELDGLTERIIGAGFAVSNGLGHGFLEAVYRNALVEELRLPGLADAHTAQLLNYLRAGRLPVGLLMNFGTPRLQWRRVIR